MPKSSKKKAPAKAADKAPAPFIVAKCAKCGMQWKHYGKDAPSEPCHGCSPDAPEA